MAMLDISAFLCFLSKKRISVIPKRNFTYGKCLQGNVGWETWALSFSMFEIWFREGTCHIPQIHCLPEILAKGFVFAAFLIMVASESPAK